ncbi:MAG: FAD binding domain-containing protein [Actinomycetota bacterium]
MAAYHRPNDLDGALDLLAEPNRVALAGGTVLNADREPPAIEVVDLQAIGLDEISADGDRLRIGAMVTLDRLADHDATPAWLAKLATAELPSTLRTAATVGGPVAAGGGESVLLAALLAAGAVLEVRTPGDEGSGPVEIDAGAAVSAGLDPASLITSISIDGASQGAVASTARTPADVPIVAAVAARAAGGAVRLALTGVASSPVLVEPDDPTAGLDPPGDFRGSPDFRRHLATVLAARAIAVIEERS